MVPYLHIEALWRESRSDNSLRESRKSNWLEVLWWLVSGAGFVPVFFLCGTNLQAVPRARALKPPQVQDRGKKGVLWLESCQQSQQMELNVVQTYHCILLNFKKKVLPCYTCNGSNPETTSGGKCAKQQYDAINNKLCRHRVFRVPVIVIFTHAIAEKNSHYLCLELILIIRNQFLFLSC